MDPLKQHIKSLYFKYGQNVDIGKYFSLHFIMTTFHNFFGKVLTWVNFAVQYLKKYQAEINFFTQHVGHYVMTYW